MTTIKQVSCQYLLPLSNRLYNVIYIPRPLEVVALFISLYNVISILCSMEFIAYLAVYLM